MIKKRSSGILMHITSLPSSYGIGDLGPSAYHFADFLEEAGQRYWQILPLNPVDEGNGYSPYSSLSAFAGNPLLISPDILYHEGYVGDNALQNRYYFRDASVDYTLATAYKDYILDVAFESFKKNKGKYTTEEFEKFCAEHRFWLDDYALFISIKENQEYKSWKEWPEALRKRDPDTLAVLERELSERILKEKFLQFIFFQQWFALKDYCDKKDIHFIGDGENHRLDAVSATERGLRLRRLGAGWLRHVQRFTGRRGETAWRHQRGAGADTGAVAD